MKTKSLIITALLTAAGSVGLMAQSTNVYSLNVVGYVNVSVPQGFSIIANPLNGTTNNLNTVIPTALDGTILYKYSNPGGFANNNQYFAGFGWFPDNTLNPGEAAFLYSPAATNLTFVGSITSGQSYTNQLYNGYTLAASPIPLNASLTGLGLPAADGDLVYTFNNAAQNYNSAVQYFNGYGWYDGTANTNGPVVAPGQGFFLLKSAATNWVASYTTN